MNTLIFDTETTGLPSKDLPFNHPHQARIIQLACLVIDDAFHEVACFHSRIKPNGWNSIHPKAQEAHGISVEMCEQCGIDIDIAYDVLCAMSFKTGLVVAHNIKFDGELIRIEEENFPITRSSWFNLGLGPVFCTMEAMTPICKLPKKSYGSGDYKWPSLSEAYKHCFNEDFKGAHDAMSDVRATAKVYQWLIENKFYERNQDRKLQQVCSS